MTGTPEPALPALRAFGAPVLLLLLGGALSFWYADRGLPLHDEGAQLTAAAKILRGGIFYRDIDTYPFPAAAYTLAGAMAVFGEHLSVARGLAGLLFCASLLALYAAARSVLRPAGAALFGLSLLSFKFLGWPAFSVYIYSDFAFAFACGALALLLHHRFGGPTWRLLLAGVLTGVAVTAKQSLGLYLALAAATALAFPGLLGVGPRVPRRAREVAVFGLGTAAPVLLMAAYFASEGLLGALLHSGLVRPFTGYLPTSGIPFHVPLAWWQVGTLTDADLSPYVPLELWAMLMREQLPGPGLYPVYWIVVELAMRVVYTSIPLALAWAVVRRLRSERGEDVAERASRTTLLAWLCLAFVASAFPRADWFHVISVYPVVVLLLLALVPPGSRSLRVGVGALVLVLGLSGALAWIQRSHLDHRLELERASVDVHRDDAWVGPLMEVVSREIPPGDPLFVHGIEAHFYFLSGRFFPWPFSQLYPGMEGRGGGVELARRLLRARPAIVIRGVTRWPGVIAADSVAPNLAAAIRSGYEPDADFFLRHAGKLPLPPEWVVQVLRPREDQ
jgi:hypothetical protein